MKKALKKVLIYGGIFGLVSIILRFTFYLSVLSVPLPPFHLHSYLYYAFVLLTLPSDQVLILFLLGGGLLNFIIYLILLIKLLKAQAGTNYIKRFITGFIFGIVANLVASVLITIFIHDIDRSGLRLMVIGILSVLWDSTIFSAIFSAVFAFFIKDR
jgi:hypothetical protein